MADIEREVVEEGRGAYRCSNPIPHLATADASEIGVKLDGRPEKERLYAGVIQERVVLRE